jgi:O-phosphoseryl-tRNA(Cys) synthetase
MSGETEQLKRKLEEMLKSNDTEWVNAVTVTLNAMYRQFGLEQQAARILFLVVAGLPQPQARLIDHRRSQFRPELKRIGSSTEGRQ